MKTKMPFSTFFEFKKQRSSANYSTKKKKSSLSQKHFSISACVLCEIL